MWLYYHVKHEYRYTNMADPIDVISATSSAKYTLHHKYGIDKKYLEDYVVPEPMTLLPLEAQNFVSKCPSSNISRWLNILQFVAKNDRHIIHIWSSPNEDPVEFLKRYILGKQTGRPLSTMAEKTLVNAIADPKQRNIDYDLYSRLHHKPVTLFPVTCHHVEGLQCPKCDLPMKFTSHRAYLYHMKRHKTGGVYICCGTDFSTFKVFCSHVDKHIHSCEFCPLRFCTKKEAQQHTEDVHLAHPGVPGTTLLELLPDDVMWGHVMPHLSLEDMAELRSTSKRLQEVVDDQLKYRPAFLSRKGMVASTPNRQALSYYANYRRGNLDPLLLFAAIENNQSEVVNFLHFKYKHYIQDNELKIFALACINGRHSAAVWVHENMDISNEDVHLNKDWILKRCCAKNCIDVVIWLCTTFDFTRDNITANGNSVILNCASVELLRWFLITFNLPVQILRSGNNHLFQENCEKDNLEMVAFVVETSGLVMANVQERDVRKVLLTKNVELTRYLCERFEISADFVLADNNAIIKAVCTMGYLKKAMWLAEHFELTYDNGMLQVSCKYNQLKVAKWIKAYFNPTKKDITADRNYAFSISCTEGHLRVAKWLHEDLGISMKYIETLVVTCNNRRFKTVKWLCETFKLSERDVALVFHVAVKNHSIEMTEWIADYFKMTRNEFRKYHSKALDLCKTRGYNDMRNWLIKRFDLNWGDLNNEEWHGRMYSYLFLE